MWIRAPMGCTFLLVLWEQEDPYIVRWYLDRSSLLNLSGNAQVVSSCVFRYQALCCGPAGLRSCLGRTYPKIRVESLHIPWQLGQDMHPKSGRTTRCTTSITADCRFSSGKFVPHIPGKCTWHRSRNSVYPSSANMLNISIFLIVLVFSCSKIIECLCWS